MVLVSYLDGDSDSTPDQCQTPCPDSDGDGISNCLDACWADSDNAGGIVDGDSDGSCDANDLCIGDDASGDSDEDGLCNDIDPSSNSHCEDSATEQTTTYTYLDEGGPFELFVPAGATAEFDV